MVDQKVKLTIDDVKDLPILDIDEGNFEDGFDWIGSDYLVRCPAGTLPMFFREEEFSAPGVGLRSIAKIIMDGIDKAFNPEEEVKTPDVYLDIMLKVQMVSLALTNDEMTKILSLNLEKEIQPFFEEIMQKTSGED